MSVGEAVPTGNTFDKYGSTNPVVRRLMAGFEGTLAQLFAQAAPESVLDVGCGEGVLTHQWAQQLGERRIVGIDLDDDKLKAEWATRQRPNLEYRTMPGEDPDFVLKQVQGYVKEVLLPDYRKHHPEVDIVVERAHFGLPMQTPPGSAMDIPTFVKER